jgi:hypothetical protein
MELLLRKDSQITFKALFSESVTGVHVSYGSFGISSDKTMGIFDPIVRFGT